MPGYYIYLDVHPDKKAEIEKILEASGLEFGVDATVVSAFIVRVKGSKEELELGVSRFIQEMLAIQGVTVRNNFADEFWPDSEKFLSNTKPQS